MNTQTGFAARAALLGLGAATLLGLAACATPGTTAAAPATTQATKPPMVVAAATHAAVATHTAVVTPAATTTTVTLAPKPSASTTTVSAKPVTHHYRDARTQWIKGASASSAAEGNYWLAAAADLKAAGTPAYAPAITELRQLTALPDAEQTPAQNTEYHQDINALNSFFGTPALYS